MVNKNLTALAVIHVAAIFCVAGCYARTTLKQPGDNWWEKGQTWVQAEGHEKWIRVINVQSDSIFGEIRLGGLANEKQEVVIPMASVQRVQREQLNRSLTIVAVSVAAGVVVWYVYIASVLRDTS